MQNITAAKSKKVVCWVIQEEDEGSCEIVFHHHRLAARRIGINAHGGCDNETYGYDIRRAPEFDQYVEKGFVPIKAMIDAGWWVTTVDGIRICDDDSDDESNFDYEKLVFSLDEKSVFLNMDACHEYALAVHDRNNQFSRFKQAILKAWPELEFVKWQGGHPWITFSVTFTFPGAKYGGSIHWDSDKPSEPTELRMAHGDMELWDEFYKQIRPEVAA